MIILRGLLFLLALGAFVVGNGVLFTMAQWASDLPSARELEAYEPPVVTRIHAGDGRLVKEFAYQKRVFVPEEAIPDLVVHAFISAEDKTFFEHQGVDLKGLLRGTLGNAIRGRRLAGGSTITQQVVKNMLVGDDRSVKRKVQEAFVARKLEQVFTKGEILELYLNEIYLGGRYYGIAAASQNYFGKSLDDLSLAEAALLGAMPKAPGDVNPYRRPEAAVARRNWVLGRMAVNGYISQEDAEVAQSEPLTTVERLNSDEVQASAYFVEEVRRTILRRAEDGDISGVSGENPAMVARLEDGSLTVRDLYKNREDFLGFLNELSERSLLSRGHLELVLNDETSCREARLADRHCVPVLYQRVMALSDPRDVFPPDMVMRLRKSLRTYELFYEDGLSIRATLDSRYQLAAQKALQRGLESYDRRHGFRGAVANIEMGDGWQDRLKDYRLRGPIGGWTTGVVVRANSDSVAVALPSGDRVSLDAESVQWAFAEQVVDEETGQTRIVGLKKGDIVYVSREPPPNVLTQTINDVIEMTDDGPWHLRQNPDVQGALVALDPHTGRILAMAGGYAYEQNQFNRAVQALRQPGSAFKPIVYAAALDAGWTPAQTVLDAPFVIDTPQGKWKPGNYSAGRFYGESTLRLGIEMSRNLMTARLAQDVGMEAIAELARRLGVYPYPSENMSKAEASRLLGQQTYLSRSLGAGETTPLRLATAYAKIVNGGKDVTPVLLDRVQDRYGQTIFQRDQRSCESCQIKWEEGLEPPLPPDERGQVLDPITAYQSVSMMEGVVQRGTATRVKAVGKHIAGKTGTTNDYIDAWFVGFAPDLVAAVWVGKDENVSLGEGESGGRAAAPIFRDFMMKALEDKTDLEFRRPDGVRIVEVDARTGKLPGPGTRNRIEEAFRPGTEPGRERDDVDCWISNIKRQNAGLPPLPCGTLQTTSFGNGQPGLSQSADANFDPYAEGAGFEENVTSDDVLRRLPDNPGSAEDNIGVPERVLVPGSPSNSESDITAPPPNQPPVTSDQTFEYNEF